MNAPLSGTQVSHRHADQKLGRGDTATDTVCPSVAEHGHHRYRRRRHQRRRRRRMKQVAHVGGDSAGNESRPPQETPEPPRLRLTHSGHDTEPPRYTRARGEDIRGGSNNNIIIITEPLLIRDIKRGIRAIAARGLG